MIQPPKTEDGWERQNAPTLIQFKTPGSCCIGLLLSCTLITIEKKQVVQYLVRDEQGNLWKFLGTYDLVQKLNRNAVGHLVRVTYLGEDPSVSRNGNAMKVFDVQIRHIETETGRESGPISDEDIPF